LVGALSMAYAGEECLLLAVPKASLGAGLGRARSLCSPSGQYNAAPGTGALRQRQCTACARLLPAPTARILEALETP
jgi:hypothetical protein